MRWLPWRRKQARTEASERSGAVAVAERADQAHGRSSPALVEPRGATLTFARDALMLSGAQVRVEEPDLLAVTLPDGARVRYTGSLARARGEADATLLVQGGAALGALLDEVAQRGAGAAFALPARGEPLSLATDAVSAPAADCGRCVKSPGASAEALCAACPSRAGRLALAGVGRITGVRELRRYDGLAAELTFLVTYRDRDGRRDEWQRLAYDAATGETVPPVALDALAACEPRPAPAGLDLTPIVEPTHADLARTLDAAAALLALRADADYQGRLHDLRLTHERLLRETPEARADLDAGYAAERGRVADLFAVGVEAELAGVAYVSTTLAEVAVRHAGGELTLTVDVGRGIVVPPRCAVCGSVTPAGTLCAQGHIVCAECAGTNTTPECAACSGVSRRALRVAPERANDAAGTLTVEQLLDLSEPLWQAFVSWYLAADGHPVEPPVVRAGMPLWSVRVDADEGAAAIASIGSGYGCAVALRPGQQRRLGAADVRAAGDACRQDRRTLAMLITPVVAVADAMAEAAASGVRLVEHDELAAFLERMVAAYATALADAEREAEARALAAVETQRAILGALAAVEREVAACANSRRVTGRGPLATATNTVTAALREAERALLAWDTLVADWLASFDERSAPDGSLRIVSTAEEMGALAERTEHLRAGLKRPIGALATTPGAGESGYTAWRKALLEQLTAACEALSWRAATINSEHWRDAQAAHDSNAVAHAEAAAQAAKHTATRAAKARDLLAARIGL